MRPQEYGRPDLRCQCRWCELSRAGAGVAPIQTHHKASAKRPRRNKRIECGRIVRCRIMAKDGLRVTPNDASESIEALISPQGRIAGGATFDPCVRAGAGRPSTAFVHDAAYSRVRPKAAHATWVTRCAAWHKPWRSLRRGGRCAG